MCVSIEKKQVLQEVVQKGYNFALTIKYILKHLHKLCLTTCILKQLHEVLLSKHRNTLLKDKVVIV
jgi:hypothetical protein